MKSFKMFIFIIILLMIIPISSAGENVSSDDYLISESYNGDVLADSIIYFDSSVENDGDGSLSSPYKYLNSSRIVTGSTLHLADGEYSVDSPKTISSNIIMGQNPQNTIISYSGNLFTVSGNLTLLNLTFNKASISNMGFLSAENVIFTNSFSTVIKTTYTTVNSSNVASNLNLDNCTFINNYAYNGAAIYSNTAIVNITNSNFINNTAHQGGAIFSYQNTVNIHGSNFTGNNATIGGAICSLRSNMQIDNVRAINNEATYYGGFLYKMYYSLNVTSSEFKNNKAGYGGALFCDYITSDYVFNMHDCNFTSNSAEFDGSAVYSIMNNENFNNNTYINNELYNTSVYELNFESLDHIQMIFSSDFNGTFPSKYDLRDYGYVSPVKNQGNDGNCWAFAALGALESCILKATGITYDLSEENMKNMIAVFSDYGWNMHTNNGGRSEIAIGYLTSWMGPVFDIDDIYVVNSYLSPLLESFMHVQNIVYLNRDNYTDNDAIKKAILDYGAVYTTTYATGAYNQYYSGTTAPNHAVCIVGWDDNYSKANFGNRPAGNGAWIAKNSWGTNWGNQGYYYVSYYDTKFAQVGNSKASFTYILNDTVRYNKIYQYDVIGETDFLLTNQSEMWYKNSFNSSSDEVLSAFSTYFNMNTNWTVEIRVNNELKTTQNGTALEGYFTINLDNFVPISKGDTFEILLRIKTSSEAWVPISEKVSATRTHYINNTSFISYDGENWIDLYDYVLVLPARGHSYDSAVACIKAFTIFNLTTNASLNYSFNKDNSVNFTASVVDQYGKPVNAGYVRFNIDGGEYEVNVTDGKAILSVLILESGIKDVTVVYAENSFYHSSNASQSLVVPYAMNLTLNVSNINYGEDLAVVNILKTTDGSIVDADLTLRIANNNYSIRSNSINTITDLFDAGNYTVYALFEGNENYRSVESFINLTVYKINPELSVNASNILYDDYLTINTALVGIDDIKLEDNLTLNINRKNFTLTPNSIYTLPLLLNASSYNLTVYYNGSSNYNAVSKSIIVDVEKADAILELFIDDISYGDKLAANTSLRDLNGSELDYDCISSVNDINYTVLSNSLFTLPVLLNASNYTAFVYFNNGNYNPVSSKCSFVVSRISPDLSLEIANINYGEDLTVLSNCSIDESLTLVVVGVGSYNIRANSPLVIEDKLNASTYTAYLYLDGNDNFNSVNVSCGFSVFKADVDLVMNVSDIVYGERFVIVNSLADSYGNLIDAGLILEVGAESFDVTSNSQTTLDSSFDVGAYDFTLLYNGSSNYNSASFKQKASVDKFTPNLSLDVRDISYGENLTVNVFMSDSDGNELNHDCILTVDGIKYNVPANRIVALPVILDAYNYTAFVYFNGSDICNSANANSSFSVSKVIPNLTVEVSDIVYGDYLIVDASLDIDDNLLLNINGVNYTFSSNSLFTLPVLLNASRYEFTIYYNGSTNYYGVSKKSVVTVNKADAVLELFIDDILYGDELTVNACLSDLKGNQLSHECILSINGVSYNVLSNNIQSVPVLLNVSTYRAFVYFNDSNYNPVSANSSFGVIKVTPNLTVEISNIVYGQNLTVRNTLTIDESLRLVIDGVGSYKISANSPLVIEDKLNASTYTAYLYLDESDNFNPVNVSCGFRIFKADVDLIMNVSDIVYGERFVIVNSLADSYGNLIDAGLILEVGLDSFDTTSNSQTTLDCLFDVESYEFTLVYNGSNNYNNASFKQNASVGKVTPDLTVDVCDILYGDYLVVNASLNDIDDELVLGINGINYTFISDSLFTIPVLLNASSYNLTVYYEGSANYNTVSKTIVVNVGKADAYLNLIIDDIVYGDELAVNAVLVDVNGNALDYECVLTVINENYIISSNRLQVLPVLLNASTYNASVYFNSSQNYNLVQNCTVFKVSPVNANLSLDILKDINNVSLVFESPFDINTTLNVTVNSDVYYVTMNGGRAILNLDNLDFGNYNVETRFSKTNYNDVFLTDHFVIDRIPTKLNVEDIEMFYHDGTRLKVVLTDINNNVLSNKTLNFTINNVTYTKTTNANGSASIPLSLNSNSYSAVIEFDGDSSYSSSNRIVTVNIKPTIVAGDLTKYYRNASQFKAQILDFNGNPVVNRSIEMNINGVFYTRTSHENGIVNLNINLFPGKYILTVINPVTGEMGSVLVTVLSRLVDNSDLVKYYRNDSQYSIRVLDGTGNPLGGVQVTFNINGVFYTRTSHENGVVKMNINLQPGDYIITAEYEGYKVSNNIRVLSIIKTSDLTMKYANGSRFGALILDGHGKPYPGQKVTFNINGVFYTRTTNADGIAYLNIKLQPGKYIITSTFNDLNEANTITIIS